MFNNLFAFLNLVKLKIQFEVKKRFQLVLLKSNWYKKNLVTFEGGMGSQILSFLELCYLQNNNKKVELNLDYFNNISSGEDFRPWSLDRYKITLESILKIGSITNNKRRLPTNLMLKVDSNYFQKFSTFDFKKYFQIDFIEAKLFLNYNNVNSNFYAIHLRRGDYLQIASKIITDEEVLQLVLKLFITLPIAPVLLISDSPVSKTWSEELNKISYNHVVCIGPEDTKDFVCHDLMRLASVLIASNSTFSLTAALLAHVPQLSIVPMEFYAGYKEQSFNLLINKLSKFSILSHN